jgi:hypothetical protein
MNSFGKSLQHNFIHNEAHNTVISTVTRDLSFKVHALEGDVCKCLTCWKIMRVVRVQDPERHVHKLCCHFFQWLIAGALSEHIEP